MMNWATFEFFLLEAFRGLRRGGIMAWVAIGIITVSLWLFGAFLLLLANLAILVDQVNTQMEIAAYSESSLNLEQAASVQLDLSKIPGVARVRFVPREEAWEKFQQDFGGRLELGEAFRQNPLPHTFILSAHNPTHLDVIAKQVANHAQIDEVRYSRQYVEPLVRLSEMVRWGGGTLVVLFGFATLLIVGNTIRLTVLARETDLAIMRLVGATHSFIQWPFVIEGLILGLVGGGAALLLLRTCYDLFLSKMGQTLPYLSLLRNGAPLTAIYITVVVSSMLLSAIGAYFSVLRSLEKEA